MLRGRLAGLKVLLLNISRTVTHDVLITFSPREVRCTPLPRSEGPVPSSITWPQPWGLACHGVLFLHPAPALRHGPTSTLASLGKKSRETVLGREEPSLRSRPSSRWVVRGRGRKRRNVWDLALPAHPKALPLSGCPRGPCPTERWWFGALLGAGPNSTPLLLGAGDKVLPFCPRGSCRYC